MNRLLTKQPINNTVSITEFLADVDSLFDILQSTYGLYDYFGH